MKKLFTIAIVALILCLVIVITSQNKESQKKNNQIETLQNQVDYLRFCKFVETNILNQYRNETTN